jgi:hypothetical protein
MKYRVTYLDGAKQDMKDIVVFYPGPKLRFPAEETSPCAERYDVHLSGV